MSTLVTCLVCLLLARLHPALAAVVGNDTEYDEYEEFLHPVQLPLASRHMAVQPLVETMVEQRAVDEVHRFLVSSKVEYFVKFEVPELIMDKYNADPEKHVFQVYTNSSAATERDPVDIMVRQFGRMIAFQLPTVQRRGDTGHLVHSSQQRSIDLCPLDHIDLDNSTVTVSLSTRSMEEVEVSVMVRIKGKGGDFAQTKDVNGASFTTHTSIQPANSKIRFFDTRMMQTLNTDSIIIKVKTRNNSDCLCSLISIQQPVCPFHDEIGEAQRFGVWSTMSEQGTVILHPWEYPDGFIIVLVASAEDDLCGRDRCPANETQPVKLVTITVGSNGSDRDYALATLSVISLYLAIILLTVTFSLLVNFKYKLADFDYVKDIQQIIQQKTEFIQQKTEIIVQKFEEIDLPVIDLPTFNRKASKGKTLTDGLQLAGNNIDQISEAIVGEIDVEGVITEQNQENEVILRQKGSNGTKKNPLERQSMEFIDSSEAFNELTGVSSPSHIEGMLASVEEVKEDELDAGGDGEGGVNTKRMKTYLFVSDLSTKLKDPTKTKSVYQKSQLYLGVLFLVSMFYSLPVLQMVFSFSYEQGITGNQDICYYNDLCRKPLGLVRDFNHVFSNLGYCVFGLLFMSIVLFKKLKYSAFLMENASIDKEEYGVPTQYGLYFAMGLALFMEGVMSSCYHVCPTNVTFQFDTTFMYLIAVLMFMKLYQVRHADVSANAVGVFFGLGVALLLETISIYYSGPIFWIFFCFVYFIVIIVVSVHAYNIGIVKYDYKILFVVTKILAKEIKHLFVKDTDTSHDHPQKARPRLVCLLTIAIVNMVLCLFFGISGTPGASNYLLAIFFLNLALYGSYYCTMKCLHGEKIHFVPCIYAGLGLLCFLPSLYFFTKKEKMTELSPSESRDMNRECVLLNFFDGHDIWHFMGGAGVFFAFLFILTLDDDVKGKKRNTINVF